MFHIHPLRAYASKFSGIRAFSYLFIPGASLLFLLFWTLALGEQASVEAPASPGQSKLTKQSLSEANEKSDGCLICHEGIEPMHVSPAVKLACVDCHGGNSKAKLAKDAHILPRYPERWQGLNGKYSAANPERTYALLNQESNAFIRFINPGDLRVAQQTCGPCHQEQVNAVKKSTMTTSSIFWGAASYANGIVSTKHSIFGESYGPDGEPQMIKPIIPPTEEEKKKGALPFLLPLPRWEIIQPGDNFRAFEDGGLLQPSAFPEIGNPNSGDEPGKPDIRLSNRGLGTGLRVSIPLLNLHKTRLNDPHLSFLGTNDHPGDYRSSGCTACHVVYANDRDEAHSGPYAQFGHLGKSQTDDKTIVKSESGHPIRHRLTRSIPSSQCMVCHMHQPNAFVNPYFGYNMWDYESDGAYLWPKEQKYPTDKERRESLNHNPEGAAVRGLWTDKDFLADVSKLNTNLQQTQFADYHGHGWVFNAVFKRDRQGNLLDKDGKRVDFTDPERFQKAVHLKDIHLERGMHCVDCHFSIDNHGDGKLHGEYGDAIEIGCEDCHGTVNRKVNLTTSGPAAPKGGTNLQLETTPFGRQRFAWRDGKLFQRSALYQDKEWEVVQVMDTITPGNTRYNEKSRLAKTLHKDGKTWGEREIKEHTLAHSNDKMTCYACHSAWVTSCFGCHLPQQANEKSEKLHFEGGETRQYSSYNPQVVRSDIFMLGINGTTKGNKIAPLRSSSALMLSSVNTNRQRFYIQQPTISAPGYSGQAFNSHVPHTVRKTETKTCTDCHLSKKNDNNAWMAQLLTLGTNFVNFMGRFAWVAEGEKGFEAIGVTEWEEPQAVLGSFLHKLAYPADYLKHQQKNMALTEAHHHHGSGEVKNLVKRGEYLYAAVGPKGLEVFDIASIDNKDFSERIVSAPVSPLGQQTYVRSQYATSVALPTNMPIDPTRKMLPENEEQAWHPIYHYAFVTDRYEGLIVVNVDTLSDRDPKNNFLKRAQTFNPEGALSGATNLTIAGHYAYIVGDFGLTIVDLNEPLNPKIVLKVGSLINPTSIMVQFRYAFVTDGEGLQVIDITNPAAPKMVASVPIASAHSVYVARTYAYVAAGARGLVIVDVERPENPFIDQIYTAEGKLNDVRDVKVASTNASLFAYVADGKNGMRVLQLTSPEATPGYLGFSPKPAPRLIATRHTHGPALSIAKGLDRDRAVDESGHQVSIFNRMGARPLTFKEMQKLYMRDGQVYQVNDTPEGPPVN
ncbi:MAG: hypothetical protein AAB300_03555 [Nitrospirota bacterium]